MNKSFSFTLAICLIFATCSNEETNERKVLSLEDTELTTTTVITEELAWTDFELILAQCMRENGYEVADPSSPGELRKIVSPLFVGKTPEQQQELYGVIQQCAAENDIPLNARDTVDPEQQAAILDAELEIAQCLRDKNLEVGDPTSEAPLRDLLQPLVFTGVITGQNLRELVRECIEENGYEVPENLREEND
tara:strand:+ start:553 stop:1131 length:579 start_codon:yes stop_codon:yes gene_type:complete